MSFLECGMLLLCRACGNPSWTKWNSCGELIVVILMIKIRMIILILKDDNENDYDFDDKVELVLRTDDHYDHCDFDDHD